MFLPVLWFGLGGCSQEENDNFDLSLEASLSVSGEQQVSTPLRCDADTELDCARMDFVTNDGFRMEQNDAYSRCTNTEDGDLRIELTATGDASSAARAVFRVHRNLRPNGTARCEGLKPDPSSESGHVRSSCDVIVYFGRDIFAATPFEKCRVSIESSTTVRGQITCPTLRSGRNRLVVNNLSFYCVPEDATTGEPMAEGEL
jgi:hypothetical protein